VFQYTSGTTPSFRRRCAISAAIVALMVAALYGTGIRRATASSVLLAAWGTASARDAGALALGVTPARWPASSIR